MKTTSRLQTITLATLTLAALLAGAALAADPATPRELTLVKEGAPAAATPWSTVIFDCATLDRCTTANAHFKVLPRGGPADGAAVAFDDPIMSNGSLGTDVPAVNIADYDELRFEFFQENGVTCVGVGLWGGPGDKALRHWYSLKRFQKIGAWDDVRFDLHFDDDGLDLAKKGQENPRNRLVFEFSKSPENPAGVLSDVRARIANVRLVKALVKAQLDPRQVRYEQTGEGLFFHHPLQLTNRSDSELTADIAVLPETLAHFRVKDLQSTIHLGPKQSRTVDVCLWLPAKDARTLPAGHVERGLAKVTVKELPGYDAIPLRSVRPVYLFGIIPPKQPAEGWLRPEPWTLTDRIRQRLRESLDWRFEAPLDVAPTHEAGRRCPKCKDLINFKDLFHYSCRNPKCENAKRAVEVGPNDPLLAANLGAYHHANAMLAKDYALAYRATGDERLGRKAVDILATYADLLGKLKKVGNCPSWHTPLASSVIFLDDPLHGFTRAYLAMERSFLMVRSQGKLFTPACLYERVRGADAPSIEAFTRIEVKNNRGQPVSDGRAMAYRIALNSGKQIDVLISFDAERYTAAECVADKTRRIAVRARTVGSGD